ncbi:MAG: hypothetical protein ACO1SX_27625 [Actinomycetota bacterium]
MPLTNGPKNLKANSLRSPRRRARRGGTLLWAVAALGVAAAMAPLFVSLCGSLCRLTARGGYRLIATQRGSAELERLRAAGRAAKSEELTVKELPSGKAVIALRPGPAPSLREAEVRLVWQENGATAQARWTTLIAQ